MESLNKKAVLVTGTSTGNGRAIAVRLAKEGYKVFATVRNEKDLQELKSLPYLNFIPLLLDITSQNEIDIAYNFISENLDNYECLYAIVNNPGVIAVLPVELTPLDFVEKTFATNTTGHIAVIQKFLPLLRKSKGRIVNITSIAGRLSFPLMGVYSASKFAMNAISDALRIELAKWDIRVITIEPGAVKTPGWVKAEALTDEVCKNNKSFIDEYYESEFKFIYKAYRHQEIIETSSPKVAKQVARALRHRHPRATYRVGFGARWLIFISKFIPLNWGIRFLVQLFSKDNKVR